MLIALAPVLERARRGTYAVGAFNINNLEIVLGVMAAAEKQRAPVILQTSEGAIAYAGMEYLAALAHTAAKNTRLPVVFHLDHGKNPAVVEQAIRSGFYTSVMIDGSHLPYKENVRVTKKIVGLAHRRGISVEAELGAIAGIEDFVSVAEQDAHLTNPSEAARFVTETGCDALAVAIGTAHGVFKFAGEPTLDIARLKKIRAAVRVPLVLHGASGVDAELRRELTDHCDDLSDCNRVKDARGVSDTLIKQAVAAGINKINIDSDLRLAFTAAVRRALISDTKTVDPRNIVGPAKAEIQGVVERKMRLFGCSQKVR